MDRLQQGQDKWIVQSKGAERWLKVHETTKGDRVLEDRGPVDSQKGKIEGNKENPL